MARLRILKDRLAGETFFQHAEAGLAFRRVVGALVWPYRDLPGCVVALGETRSRQNFVGARRHDVHLLQEYVSEDCGELVDWLARMTEDWMIRNWATPMCDKRANLIEDMNYEQRKRRRSLIRYGDPLGWSGRGEGLLPFYHAFAQRRTMNEKTLFLGNSQCADDVAALGYAEREKSILEFPCAAALCFALAEIDMNPDGGRGNGRKNPDAMGPADDLGGY